MSASSKLSRRLPLRRFRHATLTGIVPSEHITYFHFESPRRFLRRPAPISIGVESSWEIRDNTGLSILSGAPAPRGTPSSSLSLIGQRVLSAHVHTPSSFVLTFASGVTLVIFVQEGAFESFCIPEANVYV